MEAVCGVGDEVLQVVQLVLGEVGFVVLEQLLRLEGDRHDGLLVRQHVVVQLLQGTTSDEYRNHPRTTRSDRLCAPQIFGKKFQLLSVEMQQNLEPTNPQHTPRL